MLHRYSFGGGRSTATSATGDRWVTGDGDHHAVSYFPSEQVFALPIFSAEGWSWRGIDNPPLFEVGHGGLQVFRIDVDAGIMPIGLIEHDTLIERSLEIGDHLYAISSGTVSAHEMNDPTVELGRLSIDAMPGEQLVGLTMYQPPVVESLSIRPTESLSVTVDDIVGQPSEQTLPSWWAPLDLPKQASPARAAAFINLPAPHRIDADVLQLLAIETVGRPNPREESPADDPVADDQLEHEQSPMDLAIQFGLQLDYSSLPAQMP